MKIFFFFLLVLAISSCANDSDKKNDYIINPKEHNIIQGEQGTILIIPKDCFVDQQGNLIQEKVTLKLIEAYNLADIIDQNLETRANDSILVTGGMVNIEVLTVNGEKVQIAAGKSIRLEVANDLNDDSNFKIFEMLHQTWDNPKPYSPYLTPIPIEEQYPAVYHTTDTSHFLYPRDTAYLLEFLPEDLKKNIPLANKTYLASKEMQERFQYLAFSEGTASAMRTYTENPEKLLWEVDSMVIDDFNQLLIKHPSDSIFFKEKINLFTKFKNQYKTKLHPNIGLKKEDINNLQNYYNKLTKARKQEILISSFDLYRLGWHNLDYYYNSDELRLTELSVKSEKKLQKILLIFKASKVILRGKSINNNLYNFSTTYESIMNLPSVPAYIIALTEEGDKLFFSKKEIKIGNNKIETLDLKPISLELFQQELQTIEKGYEK